MNDMDMYESDGLTVTLEIDNEGNEQYSSYITPNQDDDFDPEFFKDEINALKTPYYQNMLLGLHNV